MLVLLERDNFCVNSVISLTSYAVVCSNVVVHNSDRYCGQMKHVARTRTRTKTNPNDTEANAACRSGNARALRKQSKCGVYHEGEGH